MLNLTEAQRDYFLAFGAVSGAREFARTMMDYLPKASQLLHKQVMRKLEEAEAAAKLALDQAKAADAAAKAIA